MTDSTSLETQAQVNPPSLGLKLAKVMLQLNRLPKSGRNREQGYPFATDADVLDTVRAKLAEIGVAFIASMLEANQQPSGQNTSKGTPIIKTVCKFEYTFIDGDSGESAKSIWYGEALDYSDKGISKAATLALKYFLLKTFMISTGDMKDDPDYESAGDESSKKQQRRQQPPAQPQRQPAPVTPLNAPAATTEAPKIDWAKVRNTMKTAGWNPDKDMAECFPAGTSGFGTEELLGMIKPKPQQAVGK